MGPASGAHPVPSMTLSRYDSKKVPPDAIRRKRAPNVHVAFTIVSREIEIVPWLNVVAFFRWQTMVEFDLPRLHTNVRSPIKSHLWDISVGYVPLFRSHGYR